jgi:hypothetical protein
MDWFKKYKSVVVPSIFALFCVIVIGLLIYFCFGLPKIPANFAKSPEIVLLVLVIGAVISLIASLAFLSGGLAALGLSDKTRALGLPEGSVRAIISLLFITFFLMISIFLYTQSRNKTKDLPYTGIPVGEFTNLKIPDNEIISKTYRMEERNKNGVQPPVKVQTQVIDFIRRVPAMPETDLSEKIALQILTAIITLVTSLAAFYFGANSVQVSRGETEAKSSLKPTLKGLNHRAGNKGDTFNDLEILGSDFDSPKEVKFKNNSSEMICTEITTSVDKIRGKFTIDKNQTKRIL